MLRGVNWQLFIDISEQTLIPFCKGPAGLKCFNLEDGTDILFRNVGKKTANLSRVTSQKSEHFTYTVAEA